MVSVRRFAEAARATPQGGYQFVKGLGTAIKIGRGNPSRAARMTLDLRSVDELASLLETTPRKLARVVEKTDSFYDDCVLVDPSKPDKTRDILCVKGELRRLQDRLSKKILRPKLRPTVYSHGVVKGRHIKSNLVPHLSSTYVLTGDIQSFYPSISHKRIYNLFAGELGCSSDVARICTRLCTHRHHLALGLITSPILADRMMRRADYRIGTMCECIKGSQPLVYTRFVDDLTVSGRFPIDSGSIPIILSKIMHDCGFKMQASKGECGPFSNQVKITKIRINRGRPDIDPDYLASLLRQIEHVGQLQHGGDWHGDYFSPEQLLGRIHYVGWINPARERSLKRTYNKFDWTRVRIEASSRGLLRLKKRIIKRSQYERSFFDSKVLDET